MEKKKILLLDANASCSLMLSESLVLEGFELLGRVTACDDLVNDIQQYRPDVVVINMDSPNDMVFDQLIKVKSVCPVAVVLFSDNGETEIIKKVVKANIAAFVVDGPGSRQLRPIIELAIERFKEINSLQFELINAKNKLQERKLIEKAKGLLMQRNNVSEQHAYQSLRKLAMKQNKKLALVAQSVIELSDLM
ncbi:MAG: ANTAR domain-containing protein [Gammaproteobacteria bacterium]|nr:ANTAR domain-containing protein [Gammaproteobacteria bacterium]